MNSLGQKKVYCVIPVHNRLVPTKRCLEYLRAQDYLSLQIIIVDDGSTDGTSEYLAKNDLPNLTVITGNGTLWWGGAMYLGIDYVTKVAGNDDFLLMLNDDVRIEKDYVSILVEESIAHGSVVVGSTQRDEVTGNVLDSGFLLDYWAMLITSVKPQAQCKPVDALPGRGALFPLSSVLSVGNINIKSFRHYLGDLDYSARARELGWEIIISNRAYIYTSSDSSDKLVRGQGIFQEYFSFRSKNNIKQRLLFFSLHGPFWLRIWAVPRYFLVAGFRFCQGRG